MPEISRFLGIVIRMYFADHAPPHFHAIYGRAEARVRISLVVAAFGTVAGAAWNAWMRDFLPEETRNRGPPGR